MQLIAASVDPPDITREHTRKMGYTFRFLCDPKATTIKQLDLLHEGGGLEAPDIARPAEFLIDPQGIVRWVNLTENWRLRPQPEDILHIIDEIASIP